MIVTKTESQSILGVMRDQAIQAEYDVVFGGGINQVNIQEVIWKLNRAPRSTLEWKYGIEVLADLLQKDLNPKLFSPKSLIEEFREQYQKFS